MIFCMWSELEIHMNASLKLIRTYIYEIPQNSSLKEMYNPQAVLTLKSRGEREKEKDEVVIFLLSRKVPKFEVEKFI